MEELKITLRPFFERVMVYNPDDLRSYQDTYSKIYFLSTTGPRNKPNETRQIIYDYASSLLPEYIAMLQKDFIADCGDEYLEQYFKAWSSYYAFILRMSAVCSYIYRGFPENIKPKSILVLGAEEWKGKMSVDNAHAKRVMLDLFEKDRGGDLSNRKLIVSILSCFNITGTPYMEDFIDDTSQYYTLKIAKIFSYDTANIDYVRQFYEYVTEEEERLETLLGSRSREIKDVIDTNFISTRVELLSEVFVSSLKSESYDDLEKIYKLISRVPSLVNNIAKIVETYLKETKIADVKDVINLYVLMKGILHSRLHDNKDILFAILRGIRYILNKHTDMSNTIKILDDVLRKNSGCKMVEDERCKMILQVIEVSSYYESRDEFILRYSGKLSNRLIHNEYVSRHVEDVAFQALKQYFGLEYTLKIKSMLEDIDNSINLQSEFYVENFQPVILTVSAWNLPANKQSPILNETIRLWQDKFNNFYNVKYPSRKITWDYNESRIIVRYLNYQLLCSFYQYTILDQFNKKSVIEKNELKNMSNITNEDVVNSLLKIKVLWPSKDGSKYTLNPKLKYETKHINCLATLTKEEVKAENSRELELSRRIQISACIVRNMKKEKVMSHQALKAEVFTQMQVKFSPTLSQFKEALEDCVEKEMIEVQSRTADSIIYKYLS